MRISRQRHRPLNTTARKLGYVKPPPPPDLRFIFTVRVTAGQSFTLPTVSNGSYDAKIEWGDGQEDDFTVWNAPERTHTYVNAGDYDIVISGTEFRGWQVNNYADRLKIIEIKNWGMLRLGTGNAAFYGCENLTVSATDILNVSDCTDFSYLFCQTAITTVPNMEQWDVSNVTSLFRAFRYCSNFNQDLNGWDVSNVVNMSSTFGGCTLFNGNISEWNTISLEIIGGGSNTGIFHDASSFNQDISGWDVSGVSNFGHVFQNCTSFNKSLNGWDVSSGTNFSRMFLNCTSFNQSLNDWVFSTTSDINFYSMFIGCHSFNGNITNWNTGRVTRMDEMFTQCYAFNQNIGSWDVSNVRVFGGTVNDGARGMFSQCTSFNQDISGWDTSSAVRMTQMFCGATSFNQDISGWDVSGVNRMDRMFDGATSFDYDLSNWDIENVNNINLFMRGVTLSTTNYDAILNSWGSQMLNSGLAFHFGNSQYSPAGLPGRNAIIAQGNTITDGGPA